MGVVTQIKMTKQKLYNFKPSLSLDADRALSFVGDSLILLPTKPKTCKAYKNIDAVLCGEDGPLCRLTGGGDVVFVEPSTRSFKIDVLAKSGLVRVFPTFGRIRVDWDGVDLHVTRLLDDDETL